MRILTFDTTLRDGAQGEGISFSVSDKLEVARRLDDLGIDYIEGGWPGSNPKDEEFFNRAGELSLAHSRLTAFGSTRLARNPVHKDRSTLALTRAGTPTVAIFGKTWDLHVRVALGISLEENLTLISETVRFLRDHDKEVIFDAEHFFDGYRANSAYAWRALEAAAHAGAQVLCLCDTNGGTPTDRLGEIVAETCKRFDCTIGIHTHNDSDLAVANALVAVREGATLVQGCLNGYGERCGNANLASIIGNLELKLGYTTIGRDRLTRLTSVCDFIAETANVPLPNDQPFVGRSAFAHKGGIHVSAVLKDSATYEHIAPEAVGNQQRVLLSELSGRANIVFKLKALGLGDRLGEDARRQLLDRMKQLEHEGYDLEAADGTFELLLLQSLLPDAPRFDVESYHLEMAKDPAQPLQTVATVSLRVGRQVHSATNQGHGPLDSLHGALRMCLGRLFPGLSAVRLVDYKVRLLDPPGGMTSKVRVLAGWEDEHAHWSTVGVSENVVEASWNALLDTVRLEMVRGLLESTQPSLSAP
jgi:2-isopropylmalate synthase